MNRRLVVDASVAYKWFFPEEDAEVAGSLLDRAERGELELIAPEFLILELLNIIWKQLRRKAITVEQSERALAALPALEIRWEWDMPHLGAAYGLATQCGNTVYDALYLALAEAEDAVLLTADGGLCAQAREGGLAERVRLLRDLAL